MAEGKSLVISFGDVEVREREFCLIKSGEWIPVEPKAFRVLLTLLRNRGKVVTKDELLQAVWGDTAVTENSLARSIALLRRHLGDETRHPLYIETVATVGYRWICPVEEREDLTASERASEAPNSAVNARTDGIPVPVTQIRQKRWPLIAVALSICILVASAVWAVGFVRTKWWGRDSGPPVQRGLSRLTFADGLQTEPTWSPDGRYIAYSSDRGGKFDVWLQQISGGNPVQLTQGPGQRWQPDWSPDGKYIAYRSEEGEGGIYVIPALGGSGLERKIASFGYFPRWSPDSSRILFQTEIIASSNYSKYYVAQMDGSPPRKVLADFLRQNGLTAHAAIWHPDGKRITIWAGDLSATPSFWTVPVGGNSGMKIEIAPSVEKELAEAAGDDQASQQTGDYTFAWSPSGDSICFERGYRGATNIWKLKVDPASMRATAVERLTTGPGPDTGFALSPDGRRLAYTAKSQRIEIRLFSFNARVGRIEGSGEAIGPAARMSAEPVLSRDGTRVVYFVPRGESYGKNSLNVQNEVWVKSLVDGSEAPVMVDDDSRWYPVWSPDGKRLAYGRRSAKQSQFQLMTWSSASHEEEPLTGVDQTPGAVWDWSPDGKWLLEGIGQGISLIPVSFAPRAETAARKLIFDQTRDPYQAHFSPDGQWIVFNADSPDSLSSLYVISASGGAWRRITDGRHWDDKPRWSPDGKIIYYLSRTGGFFNLWGIRFDPSAGKTVGEPFQVSKFDRAALMIPEWMSAVGMSLTEDKLVITMAEESGNIWMLDNVNQ